MVHESHNTHEAECCLPPGEYTLECKDSYGDGWHGGYITINGTEYCKNFNSSSLETHEILIGDATEPEGKLAAQGRLYHRIFIRSMYYHDLL